ncbi:aminotransferase class I/II-fold pyridoxal phosphate-dependent enzyme [Nocardioides sp. B-3]|uniref:aminotransferase class I/II-fold pyridoxal phosphate-dependent enzyme n=1 Tax=Nocardioides sp. B-3 TaxID=2895565 RepID=UPI00300DBEF2
MGQAHVLRRDRAHTLTASSTSRSVRPSTRRPRSSRAALRAAADSPGYPTTIGLPETRQAAIDWLSRRFGVTGLGPDGVLPVIGSKELIGSMAIHLGIGAGDLIGYPALAYPTYEVGAALAGARALATDSLTAFGPETPRLLWLNSPSNPTGKVLPLEHLRKVVEWCRERGTIPGLRRVLPRVRPGHRTDQRAPPRRLRRLPRGHPQRPLAVQALQPRGLPLRVRRRRPGPVGELLAVRKNLGLQMPMPQQRAMIAALDDDAHVVEQHATYAARRAKLKEALLLAGFTIDHSEASLYLWSTRGEDCWSTVAALAELGILVAPGDFYGSAGSRHVRVAFTATDERIDAAVDRLAGS